MPKTPRKPKREDFNEAAFRVVREATEEHEPEPQADGDSEPDTPTVTRGAEARTPTKPPV
jgi:hypothetical protein